MYEFAICDRVLGLNYAPFVIAESKKQDFRRVRKSGGLNAKARLSVIFHAQQAKKSCFSGAGEELLCLR